MEKEKIYLKALEYILPVIKNDKELIQRLILRSREAKDPRYIVFINVLEFILKDQ